MNQDEATAFIIKELARNRNRSDILMILCREMNINWPDAERLIKQVEAEHSREVVARQSPILIVLGMAILVGGLGMAGYAILYFFSLSQMDAADKLISMRRSFYIGGTLLTGLAMVTGSLIGLWKTFRTFFEG